MKITHWLKKNYWLTLILTVAAGLRFYHADHQSLWVDEVLSMNDANPNLTFKQFKDSVLLWEAFPHLYFLMLKYVLLIFGYTSMVARLFSAVIGIAGVYSMYLMGREFFSRRAGLIAAALTCVNIFHLSHSQEVRPYGLFFLFTVLAFYRMSVFIKEPSYRNAILYGICAGLIINAHFFGLITLFAQCLVLLFLLVKIPSDRKKQFFIYCLISGVLMLLLTLINIKALLQITEIKSFWIPKPGPDAFTVMFREFFGNSEMVIFLAGTVVLYYIFRLFAQSNDDLSYDKLTKSKLMLSFVLLFTWFTVSLVLPLIKSYLDVSMILTRYFINILPVLIMVVAIGIDLIANKIIRNAFLLCLLLFSLMDIFIVKDYYDTPSRTQFRELTTALKEKNGNNDPVVVFWGWIFPYFFTDQPETKIIQKPFDEYIRDMKNNAAPQTGFWLADANSRPYALAPDDQAYLAEHFIQREKLEYFDAWAYHYVPKNAPKSNPAKADGSLDLSHFVKGNLDGQGNLVFFENGHVFTPLVQLEKGEYHLIVQGKSTPEKPIKGENAHFRVKLKGKQIGEFFLDSAADLKPQTIPFTLTEAGSIRLLLLYDNDVVVDGIDRNAMISSVRIVKR